MPNRLTAFPKWNDLSGKYAPKVTYFAMIAIGRATDTKSNRKKKPRN